MVPMQDWCPFRGWLGGYAWADGPLVPVGARADHQCYPHEGPADLPTPTEGGEA